MRPVLRAIDLINRFHKLDNACFLRREGGIVAREYFYLALGYRLHVRFRILLALWAHPRLLLLAARHEPASYQPAGVIGYNRRTRETDGDQNKRKTNRQPTNTRGNISSVIAEGFPNRGRIWTECLSKRLKLDASHA